MNNITSADIIETDLSFFSREMISRWFNLHPLLLLYFLYCRCNMLSYAVVCPLMASLRIALCLNTMNSSYWAKQRYCVHIILRKQPFLLTLSRRQNSNYLTEYSVDFNNKRIATRQWNIQLSSHPPYQRRRLQDHYLCVKVLPSSVNCDWEKHISCLVEMSQRHHCEFFINGGQ